MNVAMILAAVLVIGGVVLAGVGLWLRAKHPSEPPMSDAEVASTMKDAVILAVEMCRADGMIDDTEMDAIRDFVQERFPQLGDTFAEEAINAAMRTTIAEGALKSRARAVRKKTPRGQRAAVVELLGAVARCDGDLNDGEESYLLRVGGWLGYSDTQIEKMLS